MPRPKPRLRQTRLLFNRLMVGLVSILGFFSAATILTAPSSLNPTENGIEASTTRDSGRDPASLNKAVDANLAEKSRIHVVKLTCDSEMNMEEQAHQIRLRGHVCSEEPVEIETSSVTNSDNNEEVATVFHKEKDFTTDVIHLKPGQNRLVITNTLSDGSKTTQVLVVRRSLASIKQ